MKAIQVDELLRFAQAALEAAGVGAEDARTIANTLVTTDTFGVFSHGTNNLYNYIRKMQAGGLDAKAVPTVEKEGPSWAIVNGNAAMGMVSSCRAMELAIEKAKKTGIAYVGVHNSCHFGAAGYYANLAAQQGLLGIAMSIPAKRAHDRRFIDAMNKEDRTTEELDGAFRSLLGDEQYASLMEAVTEDDGTQDDDALGYAYNKLLYSAELKNF